MLNVLINAYAVSPNWGSEPGVGWNWIKNIAKSCNVFVITESEWELEIQEAVELLPQKDNLHFYFNPVTQDVRNMCWQQGNWHFYTYYRQWQKKALAIAKEIIAKNRIDVIHQLNMIGFREPGYLWTIKDIPYVWGPIGNMAPLPLSFLKGSSKADIFKMAIKNVISYLQARTGRVRCAVKRADRLITVLDSSAEIIKRHYGRNDIIVIPETGLVVTEKVEHEIEPDRPIRLLWVGRFIATKKLDIALEILSRLKDKNKYELHIIGWGSAEEECRYKAYARSLGIVNNCIWYGKISHDEVQQVMRSSDIFLFTSVVEGTPHVILEAISNNLPVVCFDTCGQGVIVNENVGWKFKIKNLRKASSEIVACLDHLERNRIEINKKSSNCESRKPELSWESKIEQIVSIYHGVVNDKNEKSDNRI